MANTYQSSSPVTPLGGNGALPALPAAQITPPTLPNPQDRTPELLQRTRDSVDRGFQMQASVLQTAAERGQAEAANRTQNSAGGVFGAALSAIGAGFSIYADLEDKKAVRKAEIARAEAEALSEQQKLQREAEEEANERLKAQLEIEITEVSRDLLEQAGTVTFEQGNIVAQRQFVRAMVQESGLPPQIQSELYRMFMEQTNGIQSGLNTRSLNAVQETVDATLQVNKAALNLEVNELVVGLIAGNPATVNPASVEQQVQLRLESFFRENNVDPLAQLQLTAEVYGQIGTAYQQYGVRTTEINLRQVRLSEAINAYQSVMQQTEGNTEARRLALAALGSEYNDIDINWGSIEVTDLERLQLQNARNEANRTAQNEFLRNNPVAQSFQSATALASAYQIFSNPGTLGAEVARLEGSTDTLDVATLNYVQLLTNTRDTYAEIQERSRTLAPRRAALYAEFEEIADKLEPNRRGPLSMTIPELERLVRVLDTDPESGERLERSGISLDQARGLVNRVRADLRALDQEQQQIENEIGSLADSLQGTGILPSRITKYDEIMPRLRQRVVELTPQYESLIQEQQLQPPRNDNSNFSAGPAISTPPVVPLATNSDGVTWPAAATDLDGIRVTSGYGMRTHPISGQRRFHQGVDIVIPSGDVRTIAGGTVIHAGSSYDPDGWGTLVTVRTPDGFVEQFNHLAGTRVSIGQVIPPGTIVGKMGSTGGSTGPHLDFRVLRNGTPDAQVLSGAQSTTMNPVDYMRMRGQQTATPLGVGRPPNQPSPANNNPLARAQQLWQSTFLVNPVTNTGTQARGSGTGGRSIQNNATPFNQALASTRRNPYREGLVKNDGEANHGYEALRRDRNLRIAVHQTASRLGIPSQWIADLIDYETAGTWQAGVRNHLGCVGMQFCGSDTINTPGELDEVAKQFGGNLERARQHLTEIGLVGQLRYFEQYFMRYANGGRDLTDITRLYAGWNGGPGRIRNPGSLVSDGNTRGNPLQHHIERLGNRTGRRYDLRSSTRGADIGHTHTTAVQGCPLCNEQLSKGIFTPHIGDIA
jgi:murein DD-endopeptidase MepM/ murein hydrolase activator NlpD